ncbi:MAG: hypothetical protein ABI905_06810 [Betaproteobacteria bacterium]
MSTPQSRRTLLKQLTALGLLGPAGVAGLIQEALAKGDAPPVPGVNTMTGSVMVNGQPAKVGTTIKPGDKIATGKGSSTVMVVGKDAFMLRENTTVVLEEKTGKPGVLDNILISTGKALLVFAKREGDGVTIKAAGATIGIRGTGCYIELQETRTYFCLCYGQASIDGSGMPATKFLKTTHHESPVWLDDRGGVMKVDSAGFVNHNDDELIMLENLTGREPPFVKMGLRGRY